MNKLIVLSVLFIFTLFLSCKKKEEIKTETNISIGETTPSNEVSKQIKNKEQVEDTVTKDGTTVNINGNEINISTKKEDKKTEIHTSKKGISVETKKR